MGLRCASADGACLAFHRGEWDGAVKVQEKVWDLTGRPNEAGNLIYFYGRAGMVEKARALFRTVEDYPILRGFTRSLGKRRVETGLRAAAHRVPDPGNDKSRISLIAAVVNQGAGGYSFEVRRPRNFAPVRCTPSRMNTGNRGSEVCCSSTSPVETVKFAPSTVHTTSYHSPTCI